jgi:dihydroorotate dehydrogenase electron transfer subunit
VVKGEGHSDQHPNYLCTCKEGPVFAADQLDWARMSVTEKP